MSQYCQLNHFFSRSRALYVGYGCASGTSSTQVPSEKIFPYSFTLLFGVEVTKPVGCRKLSWPRQERFAEEVLMMELLAAEESDEGNSQIMETILNCESLGTP
jgi:hypothetical protein